VTAILENLIQLQITKLQFQNTTASISLNAAQGEKQSCPTPIKKKTDQLSQNFITINNTKCPDTKMKIVIGAVTLKMILFTLLHNMFG
jgi:hypothetical protein